MTRQPTCVVASPGPSPHTGGSGRLRDLARALSDLCLGVVLGCLGGYRTKAASGVGQSATVPSAAAALWQVSTRPRESRGGSGRWMIRSLGRSALQLIENQFAMVLSRAMMLLARGHSFMPVIEFAEWRRWFSASRSLSGRMSVGV
jgi:hypothetical protein